MSNYENFIASKHVRHIPSGFEPTSINPRMKDWQAEVTRWQVRLGKAACCPDTGLGKTFMQLEIANQICQKTGGNCLLFAPLAVGRQTVLEAAKFGIETPIRVCSSQQSVEPGITVTNYEKMHKFDPSCFVMVGLDEGSILKSIAGKTRDALIAKFQQTPYRYVFTATPSPNDIMELGSYCEFLGIMSRAQMLATFFTHDGGETSKWRLRGHAEKPFFDWLASWMVMFRKPSDIGYSNDGYNLPPLNIHEHVIESGKPQPGMLFEMDARTLGEQRTARRNSIPERVALAAEMANVDPAEPIVAWCNLNDESRAAHMAINDSIEITGSQPDHTKEKHLIDFTDGLKKKLVSKGSITGFGLNWQHCCKSLHIGLSHSAEEFYQCIRRFYRFGQKKPVEVHIIISGPETVVLDNVRRKLAESDRLVTGLVQAMGERTKQQIGQTKRQAIEYKATQKMELPSWVRQSA